LFKCFEILKKSTTYKQASNPTKKAFPKINLMSGDPHKKKKKSYFGSYDTLIILFLPLRNLRTKKSP